MNNMYGNNYLGGSPYNLPVNQQPQQNIMVVQINNDESVNSYPVAAGTTVLLMNYQEKKFWLKTTGADGFTCKIIPHTFSVIEDENEQNDYVTKKDFEEFKKMVDDLLK